jgi:hypothetical protein
LAGVEIGETVDENGPTGGTILVLEDHLEEKAKSLGFKDNISAQTQMDVSPIVQQAAVKKGPNLRTWKRKASKGDSNAANVGKGHKSNKKRQERLHEEDGELAWGGKQLRLMDVEEDSDNQELVVADFQPHCQQ